MHHEEHRVPLTMLLAIIILSVCSIFGGFFGDKLKDLLGYSHGSGSLINICMATAVSIAGIVASFCIFRRTLSEDPYSRKFWFKLLSAKYFVDELYGIILCRPFLFLCRLCLGADFKVVDNGVHLLAYSINRIGKLLRFLQSGRIEDYLLFGILGIFVSLILILLR